MSKTIYAGGTHSVIDKTKQSYDKDYSIITPNVLVLHSTEGWDWPTYDGGLMAPNMTVKPDFANQRLLVRQHFPANHSSRALEHRAGTIATNTLGAFQIEIIGTCDPTLHKKGPANHLYMPELPDWAIAGLAEIALWLNGGYGLKLQDAAPRGWAAYPASGGDNAKTRMKDAEWENAYGICGHAHVPHNSHGDPGKFPIVRLVAAATGTAAPPVDPPVTPPVVKPKAAVWGKPATWVLGATGADVTKLGERIVVWSKALGLPAPYKVGPGPEFTETDRAALSKVQVALGYGKTTADLKKGGNSDGYPGTQTFKDLAADPPAKTKPKPVDPTTDEDEVTAITANLASYDTVGKGEKTRVARGKKDIPDYLLPKAPMWFHFQECAIDMWPELDKTLKGYVRVPEGGKGRESYYRKDAGITIIEAKLINVSHMLAKDTKEMLVICWERNGKLGVTVNFHSENQGIVVQPLQLRDAMTTGRNMADEHEAPRANIHVTGDSNFKGAAAFAKLQGWSEAIYLAKKKIDLQWLSTNAWTARLVVGLRIDVDVFQKNADLLEAEQLFGAVIADHWPHRVLYRLVA